jgi:hypothetical protein
LGGGKEIERGERGYVAHWRWRIWPKELADTTESGEGFHWLEAKSLRERKGGEGGFRGGFIGAMAWEGGLGSRRGVGSTAGGRRACPGLLREEEGDSDPWDPDVSGREEERSVPLWGWGLLGHGLFQ